MRVILCVPFCFIQLKKDQNSETIWDNTGIYSICYLVDVADPNLCIMNILL